MACRNVQEQAKKVVLLVHGKPGIDRTQIAEALGVSIRMVRDYLCAARRGGEIGPVKLTYQAVGWFPADMLPEQLAIAAARVKNLKSAKNKRRWAAEKVRREMRKIITDDSDEPVAQFIVPALSAGPLPFQCVAPNSVFTWRPAA